MTRFQNHCMEARFAWKGIDYPFGFEVVRETGRDGRAEATKLSASAGKWCEDQFGPEEDRWIQWNLTIRFRDQTDATAFRLRWC